MEINFCLDGPEDLVPPADHVETGDGRVVADLLCIDGAAVYGTLVRFTQNRVERLLGIQEKQRTRNPKYHRQLHPLNWILVLSRLLKKLRRQSKPPAYTTQV